MSPLSIFIYSKWPPIWLPASLIFEKVQYFNVFCHTSMLFYQDRCSGVRRKGLRSIGCTVAIVTTIMLPLSLKYIAKLVKLTQMSRTLLLCVL